MSCTCSRGSSSRARTCRGVRNLPSKRVRRRGPRRAVAAGSTGSAAASGIVRRRKGRRPHPGGAQDDPRRPPGRRTDLRDPGQPVSQQDPCHPQMSNPGQGLVVTHPTSAPWADPIEAQFGPLRAFTMANSDYPNHVVLARDLHAYLRRLPGIYSHVTPAMQQRITNALQRRWTTTQPTGPHPATDRVLPHCSHRQQHNRHHGLPDMPTTTAQAGEIDGGRYWD